MKKLFVLITALFLVNTTATAKSNMIRVKAIGSSPRGQYVAFEEFGYKDNNRKVPFSKIRVMNMWKNKYVEKSVNIIGSSIEENLSIVRNKAKQRAMKKLKKFNISL